MTDRIVKRRRRRPEPHPVRDRLAAGLLLAGIGAALAAIAAMVNGWPVGRTIAVGVALGAILGSVFGPRAWPLLQWF